MLAWFSSFSPGVLPFKGLAAVAMLAFAGGVGGQTAPAPVDPAASQAASTPVLAASQPQPQATPVLPPSAPFVEAREAWRKRDTAKLASLKAQWTAQNHILASWADYWDLNARLGSVSVDEVEAFYARWRGRYVEDRLRNDWLLELGRRRDWPNLARDHARFRMNDDREVTCYAITTQHQAGKPVRAAALDAWLDQRDADDGCQWMAQTLLDAGVFTHDDVWLKVRTTIDLGRLRAARQAATLLSAAHAETVAEIAQHPTRWLNTKSVDASRKGQEWVAIALARMAATDPELAAASMRAKWQSVLSPALGAWTWMQVGEQASQKLMTAQAMDYYGVALRMVEANPKTKFEFSDENLAWAVRAAIRSEGQSRWPMVSKAVELMRPAHAQDPAWQYWLARAQLELAKPGAEGDATRQGAQQALKTLSGELHFYGTLAAEDLGQSLVMPPKPPALTADELRGAQQHRGLQSALALIAGGLRDEGVREWNYSLRGMDERQLLAAAHWACTRQVWDRCINTSDRTRVAIDMEQRYPTPFKRELMGKAKDAGLDPAYVFGLIRQESRFIPDVRSHVGASGLMQLMPATARWTAQKAGVPFKQDQINDPALNLTLGTYYLKTVLDDFGGSQAMAAAAYNAGPSRPRRWREGATVEAAAWAESIPFTETRDYVKKVLNNAVIYTAMLGGKSQSLKARLGEAIGPRNAVEPVPNKQIP